ncbi:MAG: type VI secretion system baseplate subunit TssE [Gemmatimonadaceae bacterium]|jgi:type VI secretion system protein ImpF|nr:type VI secretion system baseplate subunit TssE [Gemmatimonadaceae bacterium]
MTRAHEPPVTLSLLDRLLDDAPAVTTERAPGRTESEVALHAAVRRDLEWLLNARQPHQPDGARYPECAASALVFGLPDLSALSADSAEAPRAVARLIDAAIALGEPRLVNVRVSVRRREDTHSRDLHFLVEADLRMDPQPVRVAFDTRLESVTGRCHVRELVDA